MSVITASQFDVKKLTTSDIKKLDNGSSQVYMNYDGKRLRVQGPQLSLPYDSSDYNGNKKFKTTFALKGMDKNSKVAKFHSLLQSVDNYVIDVATANAGKWFKMPGASRDLIAAFFTPSVKISKDKEGNPKDYPPSFAPKLSQRNGAFDVELYDDKNTMMEGVTPLEVLRRGAEVVPICDATGIWIGDKKFGLTWRLHQARVVVPGEGSSNKGFLGLDEEENNLTVSNMDEELMSAVLPTKVAESVVQKDEDEEEEEDDDDIVAAPPVPVKKTVSPTPVATVSSATPVKKVVRKVVKA
jgi:hypothetical protein